MVLIGIVGAGSLVLSSRVWADDTAQLKNQVQALQERVDQLEAQLADKQQAMPQAGPSGNGYVDQWADPFTQMMLMRQQMERNMRQAQAFADIGTFNPRMDMKQMGKQYLITMDLPGMDKDKINVEVKKGMLIISGERHSETGDNKNNQYYRQERSFGSFLQAIPLPEDAQTDQVEASYKNGVLTVTVARLKKEEKKWESQKITVK